MMISPTTVIGISQPVLYQRLPMRTSGIRAMTGGIRRAHSARTIRSSAGLSSVSRGSGALRGSEPDAAPVAARALLESSLSARRLLIFMRTSSPARDLMPPVLLCAYAIDPTPFGPPPHPPERDE